MRDSLTTFWKKLKSLWRRNPEPQDPFAGVRVPLKRGPHDRRSAVALAEPEESKNTGARAKHAS